LNQIAQVNSNQITQTNSNPHCAVQLNLQHTVHTPAVSKSQRKELFNMSLPDTPAYTSTPDGSDSKRNSTELASVSAPPSFDISSIPLVADKLTEQLSQIALSDDPNLSGPQALSLPRRQPVDKAASDCADQSPSKVEKDATTVSLGSKSKENGSLSKSGTANVGVYNQPGSQPLSSIGSSVGFSATSDVSDVTTVQLLQAREKPADNIQSENDVEPRTVTSEIIKSEMKNRKEDSPPHNNGKESSLATDLNQSSVLQQKPIPLEKGGILASITRKKIRKSRMFGGKLFPDIRDCNEEDILEEPLDERYPEAEDSLKSTSPSSCKTEGGYSEVDSVGSSAAVDLKPTRASPSNDSLSKTLPMFVAESVDVDTMNIEVISDF